jgi:hypothetical protein
MAGSRSLRSSVRLFSRSQGRHRRCLGTLSSNERGIALGKLACEIPLRRHGRVKRSDEHRKALLSICSVLAKLHRGYSLRVGGILLSASSSWP